MSRLKIKRVCLVYQYTPPISTEFEAEADSREAEADSIEAGVDGTED